MSEDAGRVDYVAGRVDFLKRACDVHVNVVIHTASLIDRFIVV